MLKSCCETGIIVRERLTCNDGPREIKDIFRYSNHFSNYSQTHLISKKLILRTKCVFQIVLDNYQNYANRKNYGLEYVVEGCKHSRAEEFSHKKDLMREKLGLKHMT